MEGETFYVIYFPQGNDMPYCRVAYDYINFKDENNDFGPVSGELLKPIKEGNKLIYNGYSLMANWHDATLFETKEEALNTILNNVDTPRIQKDKLQIIEIKIEKTLVYGTK